MRREMQGRRRSHAERGNEIKEVRADPSMDGLLRRFAPRNDFKRDVIASVIGEAIYREQ
jgi:hypothetical protein